MVLSTSKKNTPNFKIFAKNSPKLFLGVFKKKFKQQKNILEFFEKNPPFEEFKLHPIEVEEKKT